MKDTSMISLMAEEDALVDELNGLLESNSMGNFSKQMLSKIAMLAQKKSTSLTQWDDMATLETLMATLSKLSQAESPDALAQHSEILRGMFSGIILR